MNEKVQFRYSFVINLLLTCSIYLQFNVAVYGLGMGMMEGIRLKLSI